MIRDLFEAKRREEKGRKEIAARMAEQPVLSNDDRAANLRSDVLIRLEDMMRAVTGKRRKDKKTYLILDGDTRITHVRDLVKSPRGKASTVMYNDDLKTGGILVEADVFLDALSSRSQTLRGDPLRAEINTLAAAYELQAPSRGKRR